MGQEGGQRARCWHTSVEQTRCLTLYHRPLWLQHAHRPTRRIVRMRRSQRTYAKTDKDKHEEEGATDTPLSSHGANLVGGRVARELVQDLWYVARARVRSSMDHDVCSVPPSLRFTHTFPVSLTSQQVMALDWRQPGNTRTYARTRTRTL